MPVAIGGEIEKRGREKNGKDKSAQKSHRWSLGGS
jgi:hypothetical protein